MARQVIKQPDGKYALYSTIVDSFVAWDMSAKDLVENARAEAANKAEDDMNQSISNADNNILRGNQITWEEAKKKHNKNSTKQDQIK